MNININSKQTQSTPAIRFILICVLLDVIGFGLIIPVLPDLVKELSPDNTQQTLWYGVLMASYGLAQYIASPLLGALSDRYGRRPILLLSQLGWGLDFLLIAFAPNLWVMLIARLIGGITGAGFTVARAYVADVTEPEKRAQGMGLIGAMFGLGFIIGPTVGGLMGGYYGIHSPFYLAFVVAMLNVLYGFFILPESLPLSQRTQHTIRMLLSKSNPLTAFLGLFKLNNNKDNKDNIKDNTDNIKTTEQANVKFIKLLVSSVAMTNLAQFMMHTTFVLFTTKRYGWTPTDNAIALLLVGVIHFIVQGKLLGVLVKRWGEHKVALVAMTIAMFEFIGFAFSTQGVHIYALIVLAFLGCAAMPSLMGLISKNINTREQGSVMGVLSGLDALMGVIAPLIATPILAATEHFSKNDIRFGTVYLVAAGLQAMSVVLIIFAFHKSKP